MAAIVLVVFWCAFGAFPYYATAASGPQFHLSETTSKRLENIEIVLEKVLETNARLERKNAELEQRIEALETENQRLNQVPIPVQIDHQENDVNADVQERNRDETTAVNGKDLKEDDSDADVGEGNVDDTAAGTGRFGSEDVPVGKATIGNLRRYATANTPPRRALLAGNSNTVAFTALISKPRFENLGVGQTIIYDHVLTNEEGGYHANTGIFTAPVSGVYVFTVDTMLEAGDRQYLQLVMDGQLVTTSYTEGYGETHLMTSSRTTVLRVRAGSEVWVRTANIVAHGDGTLHGNDFSSFSGWIINVD